MQEELRAEENLRKEHKKLAVLKKNKARKEEIKIAEEAYGLARRNLTSAQRGRTGATKILNAIKSKQGELTPKVIRVPEKDLPQNNDKK